MSRSAWQLAQVDAINAERRAAAVFVNLPPLAASIAPHPGNVLWLTNAPTVRAVDLAPFARVFVSDPGYAAQVVAAAGPRLAGVLPFACDPQLHAPATGIAVRDVCLPIARRSETYAERFWQGAGVHKIARVAGLRKRSWRSPHQAAWSGLGRAQRARRGRTMDGQEQRRQGRSAGASQ